MVHTVLHKTVGILAVQLCFCVLQVSSQFINPNGCPSISTCPIQCPNGYAQDTHGCNVCKCADATGTGSSGSNLLSQPMNAGGNPSQQSGANLASPSFIKPCVNNVPCELSCDYGYENGPDGCQFCLCASPTSSGNTYNPCPGAAPTCDAVCPYGLLTESTGCHRCECDEGNQETTAQPTTTTTLSPEECIMKITECQIKFPFGFMTDDSCTMCISKDDIYPPFIPEERQPMIRLSNPCIQGFDMCRIFCATGYRTGPRSCQYCACNG